MFLSLPRDRELICQCLVLYDKTHVISEDLPGPARDMRFTAGPSQVDAMAGSFLKSKHHSPRLCRVLEFLEPLTGACRAYPRDHRRDDSKFGFP